MFFPIVLFSTQSNYWIFSVAKLNFVNFQVARTVMDDVMIHFDKIYKFFYFH